MKRINGNILWFDQRDGHGIATDERGSEYYIDSSSIDMPEYMFHKVRVTFELNTDISHVRCARRLCVDLDHAAELQTRTVASLQACGAENLRPGAIEAAEHKLNELLTLTRKVAV